MKINLQFKLLASFTAVLIIASAVSAFSYKTQLDRDEAARWVTHTNTVRDQISQALLGLVNMETGFRGYLLSGKDEFLEPYHTGKALYNAAFAQLVQLTADNPAQVARWQQVNTLAQKWDKEWVTGGIQLRQSVNAGTAQLQQVLDYEASAGGKQEMDSIRALLAEGDQVEGDLLIKRGEQDQAASALGYNVILWGTLFAIGLGLVIAFYLARDIANAAQQMVRAAEQIAEGDLNQTVSLVSKDEMGALADAFRQMMTYLQGMAEVAEQLAQGDLTVEVRAIASKLVSGGSSGRITGPSLGAHYVPLSSRRISHQFCQPA